MTFFEAQAEKTTDSNGTDSTDITVKETTGPQNVTETPTVNWENPVQPEATVINGFGGFFVVAGGCRMVTFVDYNRTWFVGVPDGGRVERPDIPARTGFDFVGWTWSGHGTYDFGKTVKEFLPHAARAQPFLG